VVDDDFRPKEVSFENNDEFGSKMLTAFEAASSPFDAQLLAFPTLAPEPLLILELNRGPTVASPPLVPAPSALKPP